MTEAPLSRKVLNKLKVSRDTALGNLQFYECLFDSLEESVERESIGQAMAQKQSFIGAVEAILNNHDVVFEDISSSMAANDCGPVLEDTDVGDHLAQEALFHAAIKACMEDVEDELTIELLSGHLEAAELAMAAIKATSLKI